MASAAWVGPILKEKYIIQFIIRLLLILVNYLFMTVLEKINKHLESQLIPKKLTAVSLK